MSDMIGAFRFKGIASQNFKLVSRSVKRPLLPPAKIKRIELTHASGAHDFEDLEYGLRQITMRVMYIGTDYYELRQRARSIAAWLSSSKWEQLIMDDEPDLYYLAKVTGELDLDNLWQSGSIDVEFDCQPFAYSVVEQTVNGDFENPGTRKIDFKSPPGSKSIIISTISGSKTILLNDKSLTYSGPSGVLMIDNVNMEATINGQNAFRFLTGNTDTFLPVLPGENTFIGGDLTYIPMWL